MSDRVDDTDMTDTATDGPSDATSDASTADQNDAEPDVPPHRAAPRSGRLDSEERQGVPYTESQVIMPTVKVVAPFAFTYGLFITFHGSGSPGGGFQGGAIMAAVVFMIAFAFGIESTRDWLANTVVVALAVGGALAFAAIGLVPVALGGAFLQYDLLPIPILDPVKYGMEAVEVVGIAPIVAGVLMGLFFLLARGFDSAEDGFGNSSFREDGPNDEGGSLEEEAADAGGDR
ncbi:MnhB domain-containing protein [Halorubrum lacusprofundi]|jgi:multicomponent Na+:H+ antiporter subunit B|uniref:Na+/H+ antiporter MnhB subunit-related protein n=1 Tax=Halorubrum lacusprofundi (strain ATCC 49239 / DSM 5036 / JCM 8891 / ACAM 34) TaxID=416348 RepID=B9LUW4_HALLT|nr:MnhB domain-containing protein [Halorubrum lacusprofundi]ACM56441.1 Na+/H+ antiporter MnhB subunit-related protein [Halorubrum lacusprofundi ATCC 49239]MCG1005287.1 cation:proton antiporter [Halorubrum lacusprofundi]